MRKYDVIFWDIDDTLLDFGKSEEYALKKNFETFGLELTDAMVRRYSAINLSYWKRLERGEVDKLTVLRNRFLDLFAEYAIEGIEVDTFRAVYQKLLGCVFYYREESDRLLSELKQAGLKQYIVTNGVAATQRSKLKLSGLDALTDGVFISEEMGAVKPAPAFFEACFERIGPFDKERAILVGDSLSSDMKGAANAGLASCWYRPQGGVDLDGMNTDGMDTDGMRVDYTIQSLWDIKYILGIECLE